MSRLNTVSTRPSASAVTRSVLFSSSTSANSTWSTSRSAMLRASPSPAANCRSVSASPFASSIKNVDASTTVTMVSSAAMWLRRNPSSNSQSNVAATGIGSDMPVDSITMWSNRPSRASWPTASIRSSRSVQQMQPLVSSTNFSSVRSRWPSPAMRAASMLTSLMSLTITATRCPSRLARMWLSTVVLPAPRKPDNTVTGIKVFAVDVISVLVMSHWSSRRLLLMKMIVINLGITVHPRTVLVDNRWEPRHPAQDGLK